MAIDNSKSKVDLSTLFGIKKTEQNKPDAPQPKPEPKDDEYEFEWGRGPWLSVFNDQLFEGADW